MAEKLQRCAKDRNRRGSLEATLSHVASRNERGGFQAKA
ncbi:hypothetical protein SynA1825c_00663 [Synechococcus sp. A18-25c]|nr:hypothetical protein SynA1825c_00663 [Synechococcus sp. A18-25c]